MKCPKSIMFDSHVHLGSSPPCGVHQQEAITAHYRRKSRSTPLAKAIEKWGKRGFIAFLGSAINEEMYSSSDLNCHQHRIHGVVFIVYMVADVFHFCQDLTPADWASNVKSFSGGSWFRLQTSGILAPFNNSSQLWVHALFLRTSIVKILPIFWTDDIVHALQYLQPTVTTHADTSLMLFHVSDNTASQLFTLSTGTVTAFLSPSKHVEGTTKHLFKQESKTRRVSFL